MTLPTELQSERLILRRWKESDYEPFARMNSDSRVMEMFPRKLTPKESSIFIRYIEESFDNYELGLWALDLKESKEFIGYVGLWKPNFEAEFTPCIEIGWRLLAEHWGHGYAPEAAFIVLEDAFNRLGLNEVVSFTAVDNAKSIRVMEKLGLLRRGYFDHPSIPRGHHLRPHVRYSITKEEWLARQDAD